jgi:predicted MFS family arabinose efflux permease
VPELIGEEHADVAEATAFFQAANRLTIFLGPPAAGILIGVLGTANVLYVDAATYLVSFVLVGLFVHPPEVATEGPPARVLDGVRFLFRDRLLRVWTPAFTAIDVGWQLLFASLPVLVVAKYHANPHILGWLLGAFGGGALVGAFASLPLVRRVDGLTLGATAFCLETLSLWVLALPLRWEVVLLGMASAGFFTSVVNAPIQALIMLRMPREVRTQGTAAFGVFNCIGAPIGLVVAGWALGHFDTRSVLAAVLVLFSCGATAFVAAALAERSSLRAASLDSAA